MDGNCPTPEEERELDCKANEVLQNLMLEAAAPYLKAKQKYQRLVENLSLTEYIGLKLAIEADGPRRRMQAIAENPFVMEIARQQEHRNNGR